MRIREENCNQVLLAGVTLVSVVFAGGAALLEPTASASSSRPAYAAVATPSSAANAAAGLPAENPARFADPTPVRVVGAPFVPNTNPRER